MSLIRVGYLLLYDEGMDENARFGRLNHLLLALDKQNNDARITNLSQRFQLAAMLAYQNSTAKSNFDPEYILDRFRESEVDVVVSDTSIPKLGCVFSSEFTGLILEATIVHEITDGRNILITCAIRDVDSESRVPVLTRISSLESAKQNLLSTLVWGLSHYSSNPKVNRLISVRRQVVSSINFCATGKRGGGMLLFDVGPRGLISMTNPMGIRDQLRSLGSEIMHNYHFAFRQSSRRAKTQLRDYPKMYYR